MRPAPRQQSEAPDPEHVAAGLDDVHDQAGLNGDRQYRNEEQGRISGYANARGDEPVIVARNGRFSQASMSSLAGSGLALCYANPAFDFAAVGPADVRQGIAQDVLRACVHGDFHLAAVETGRERRRASPEETTRTPTSSRSGRSCAGRRKLPANGSRACPRCRRRCATPIARHRRSGRNRPTSVRRTQSRRP